MLDHANERAATKLAPDEASGCEAVERTLLGELDDGAAVRDTPVVWGEALASAMFEPELRDQLREATGKWTALIAGAIQEGVADGSIGAVVDADACAERLTALVDGLSSRRLAGVVSRETAQALPAGAIALELGRPDTG
jgi:hypothetical protein